MPSYCETSPILRTAMDLAVRIDKAVQRFPVQRFSGRHN